MSSLLGYELSLCELFNFIGLAEHVEHMAKISFGGASRKESMWETVA
jgi:hypothetical protein